jgi:DNA polymerase-3 subunit beta
MKFVIKKDALIAGLQQVMNIVGTKLTMPILSNVLIEATADRNQIALSTTNLDIGMRCILSARVAASGSVTLPVKKLASIVKALPAEEVECEMEDGALLRLISGGLVLKFWG